MELMLYFIYYVSFAILSVVLLEIPSLRTSGSDLFTTTRKHFAGGYDIFFSLPRVATI